MDNETLRAVATQVAGEAAELASTIRDESVTGGAVRTKSTETDVVTEADRAAERLVRDRLAELRPGESVLGEEEGGAGALDGLRWVVDPIDGTVNYLYGYPWYAVSLAAQVDGRSDAGAVVEPVSGRIKAEKPMSAPGCGCPIAKRASAKGRSALPALDNRSAARTFAPSRKTVQEARGLTRPHVVTAPGPERRRQGPLSSARSHPVR